MESQLIAWLRERIPPHPRLRLGLGDDAAVFQLAREEDCVVTVDALMDGVDFNLVEAASCRFPAASPQHAGRKALAVNLSDLAAMAARPLLGVVALVLPKQGGLEIARGLYEGMLPLAEQYDLAIAGGDTNSWDHPLVVSVTLIGRATGRGPLRRSGAQPGDRIVATGRFGGSLLGKHFHFEPRIQEAIYLHEHFRLHAGIDVSDGLALDLSRLAEESGCGAVLDLSAVPIAEDAKRLAEQSADGRTPLDHALSDGEDFELLLAVPPEEAEKLLAEQPLEIPLAAVGEFIAEPGLWRREGKGPRRPLTPGGWLHDFS
ncbi:MAG: thiamine-phosphate kinase [Pirellulales bacterium]|nr:thiamine-phosphate kinase [Pirellulales bacterium]